MNWSKFYYDIGLTSSDSDYPINLSEFIKKIFFKVSLQKIINYFFNFDKQFSNPDLKFG